ncbi:MAG TPA: c-type cytochrome [Usitatibacter sp.]|nr:c-type cytochrome [Usitatibacter sp.]
MSEPQHHTDPIEENIDSHPATVAIGILIGAVAVIIGIILLAQFAIGAYGVRSMKNDPSMRPDRVAERIAPVAQVAIDPNTPSTLATATPAAPAAPAAAPATPAAIPPPAAASQKTAQAGNAAGKKTFDAVCTACHSAGVLGAPKFGDKAAWAPRIAQGKNTLYNAALHGLRAMPAKGGNASLSDADVKAAVDYMVAAAK